MTPKCQSCKDKGVHTMRRSTGCDWEDVLEYCWCKLGQAKEAAAKERMIKRYKRGEEV